MSRVQIRVNKFENQGINLGNRGCFFFHLFLNTKLDSGNGSLKTLKLEERGGRRYTKSSAVMFEILELDKNISRIFARKHVFLNERYNPLRWWEGVPIVQLTYPNVNILLTGGFAQFMQSFPRQCTIVGSNPILTPQAEPSAQEKSQRHALFRTNSTLVCELFKTNLQTLYYQKRIEMNMPAYGSSSGRHILAK